MDQNAARLLTRFHTSAMISTTPATERIWNAPNICVRIEEVVSPKPVATKAITTMDPLENRICSFSLACGRTSM